MISKNTPKAILSLLVIGAMLSWSAPPTSSRHSFQTDISRSGIENAILFYVNDYRIKKGLSALAMNQDISSQAQKHSVDMATNKISFGHDGFEHRVKLIAHKLGNIHSSAENVAYGNLTPKEVVAVWLKSSGHRKNIEGSFTFTGIGIATSKDNITYFTQIFTAR